MRQFLVVGNWKMNGTRESVELLLKGLVAEAESAELACVEVGVCPPALYIDRVVEALASVGVVVGGQDLCAESAGSGAYTGQTSGLMLKDAGCKYVLCGHSERREYYGDSDSVVAAKVQVAQASGLVPILCVGETLAERESGDAKLVIERQLEAVFSVVAGSMGELVVAYEPVWAIGTGLSASPDQAQEIHGFIRGWLVRRLGEEPASMVTVLYGGSVKPDNAGELFSQHDIDGALIGGASLSAVDFYAIAKAAGQND
jgi:triosephosphate isomerase